MEINFQLIDLLLVSPALVLFLASLIPLLLKVVKGNKEQNPFATICYGFMGIIAAAGLTITNLGVNKLAFANALVFDGISYWSSLIVLLMAALSLIYAKENLATNNRLFSEFVFLLLNATAGMMVVAWANDLMTLFIGIEIMSLCLYIMIALNSEERFSKEAAFKYFVLGSFATAILLYGVAFIYGTVNSTYLHDIKEVAADLAGTNRLFLLGFVFLVVGLAFKVSIVPFHAWTPDVYQGSATPLTGFMATGVKVATLAFFLRVMATEALITERAYQFVDVLQWLAVLTIIVGNVAAIMQSNLKRMLAYSSVAHTGYVLIGLIAAAVGGQAGLGASGVIFYVFAYSIMTIGAFGVLSLLEKDENTWVSVDDLKGLASRNPWLALCFSIFLLSLAGIPPTIGFFGKFFLFSAAVKQGFMWLAVWGVIGSVISVYYYLRPIVAMYMSESEEGVSAVPNRALSYMAVVGSAFLVLAFGLLSDPFYQFVSASVVSLF